ncbi:MAG: carbohydrate ABC transporter permease [Thermodesulfovibrionales bacterium]
MNIKSLTLIFKSIVIGILLLIFLSPIVFQIISGFKDLGTIYDPDQIVSLKNLTIKVWKDAVRLQKFLLYLKNSVLATLISTIIVMFFAIPAAFGLAKLKMNEKTRKSLSFEFLAMRMLPGIAVIIPIFVVYKKIGLLYTLPGLIIMYIVFNIPLATWLLEGFFKEVPNEISEAARIDGCSSKIELLKIIIPLSAPGLLSVTILTFIFIWNEFMFASVLTTSSCRTLPVWAAYTTYQHFIVNYSMLGISSTVMIVPVIIFAILMQKYLVRGLSFGAIKE